MTKYNPVSVFKERGMYQRVRHRNKPPQNSLAEAELEVSSKRVVEEEAAFLPKRHRLGSNFWRRVFDLGPERWTSLPNVVKCVS